MNKSIVKYFNPTRNHKNFGIVHRTLIWKFIAESKDFIQYPPKYVTVIRIYVQWLHFTLLWDILRFAKASFFDDRTSESYYRVFKIRHSYSLKVKILMCKWSKSIGWDVSLKIIKYYSPPPIIRIRQRVALILCSQSAKNAVFLYEYCFAGGGGESYGHFLSVTNDRFVAKDVWHVRCIDAAQEPIFSPFVPRFFDKSKAFFLEMFQHRKTKLIISTGRVNLRDIFTVIGTVRSYYGIRQLKNNRTESL